MFLPRKGKLWRSILKKNSTILLQTILYKEALTSGKTIKDHAIEIVERICDSEASIDENSVNDIILQQIQTKEYLVAGKTPPITANDFDTLQNCQKKKKKKSSRHLRLKLVHLLTSLNIEKINLNVKSLQPLETQVLRIGYSF